MSTNIYNYDGSLLTTIADGSISTNAASIKFPGRGFVNYGGPVNENMLWIMQNFAASTSPSNPVNGQTWYDTANKILKVYDNLTSSWVSVGGVIVSGSSPTGDLTQGDFWYNSATNQLFIYSGSAWILLGPLGASNGLDPLNSAVPAFSTFDSVRISDGTLNHSVWRITVNNTLLAIFSLDAAFVPNPAVPGFSTIRPGLNLNSTVANIGVSGDTTVFRNFQNNLPATDNVYNLGSPSFRFANVYATSFNGTVTSALSAEGIDADNDVASAVLYPVMVADSGSPYPAKVTKTKLIFNAATGAVGINTNTPASTLQVVGGIRAIQGLPADNTSNVGYSFGDDGDTGMFSPTTGGSNSGVIQWYTNGTPRIILDSTGVGIGTTSPAASLDVSGSFSIAKANVLSTTLLDTSGTISWDASLGQIATVTLTNTGRNFINPTNLKVGIYTLIILQDSAGARTITTWGSSFKWIGNTNPSLNSAPNGRTIFAFYSDGTNLYESSSTVSGVPVTSTTPSAGQILIATASNTYTPATVAGTTNRVTVTSGSGSMSITTPQDTHTSANFQIGSLGVGTAASGTTGEIRATNDITAFYSSDKRLKTNIRNIDNPIQKIKQINGVTFDWTEDYINSRGGEDEYFVRKNDVGVIAQEIQAVLPEVVGERTDGTLAVKYDRIVSLLIEAVKEQQKEIESLKDAITKLR